MRSRRQLNRQKKEERRKEIEVRVAAARLLQQKSETPQSQNDDGKDLDSSSGSVHRVGERRKFATTRGHFLQREGTGFGHLE